MSPLTDRTNRLHCPVVSLVAVERKRADIHGKFHRLGLAGIEKHSLESLQLVRRPLCLRMSIVHVPLADFRSGPRACVSDGKDGVMLKLLYSNFVQESP